MKRTVSILAVSLLALAFSACDNVSSSESVDTSSESSESVIPVERIKDTRSLTAQEYTVSNIVTTDRLGRSSLAGDVRKKDMTTALFYHLWHGNHETGIYDISELEKTDPDAIWDLSSPANSPVGAFHYWGEPLYGYYQSKDPWVLTRHAEQLTMAGIDYLVFDTTNAYTYFPEVEALCEVFKKFQDQGWNVPKISFYTNSHSARTVQSIYETFYKPGKYESLWWKFNDKPLIVGRDIQLYDAFEETYYNEIMDFFFWKEAQWPNENPNRNGFPWMDWGYPQRNYRGYMSVSVAQHPTSDMSDPNSWARGFDFNTMTNSKERSDEGTNFEQQWENALFWQDYGELNNIHVTGWNEWMAIKQNWNDKALYCDVFNQEYSRDIEMMKGGHMDNFYMQLVRNNKKFKWEDAKHYEYEADGVTFLDFEGDALERNYKSICDQYIYTDKTNRNDIVETKVSHDSTTLTIVVKTKGPITEMDPEDQKWMNVLIGTFAEGNPLYGNNYDFRINGSRTATKSDISQYSENGTWEKIGEADYAVNGNEIAFEIPLALISKSESECHIKLKAFDNVTIRSDMEEFYIEGDSAPIGRLSYEYGY